MHEVLHAQPGRYQAGRANRRILPVLPSGTVLTLDGGQHHARRQLLAPLFHGNSLEAFAPIISEIAAEEIADWPIGVPFAALPRTRFMTLRVAARLLLGIQRPRLVSDLQRHVSRALRPYPMPAGVKGLRRLGPASPQAAARRSHARALFALLLAAHETTATALAWSLKLLAHDPDTVTLLAEEVGSEDRPRLDAVLSEILRHRPPLVDIVRELSAPTRLGHHDLAAGTLIPIPPPLIHRHRHASAETLRRNDSSVTTPIRTRGSHSAAETAGA